jgi:hypothetical protein
MELVGKWVSDPEDSARQLFGALTLDFLPDGRLIYTIHRNTKTGKPRVLRLLYSVDDGILATGTRSGSWQERTPFSFTSDGKLILTDAKGLKSSYIRADY